MRIAFQMMIAATALAVPALAQAAGDDRNGSAEIIRGDYVSAERTLVDQRRLFPDHADLTLNLAAVYHHAGRVSEARALYRDVLRRPDEDVNLVTDRTFSAHQLATIALQRLERTQLSVR
ncbi:tetratricopeptide repeat protein [Sphingomonas sp. So64.6b]|uniref:tetratricopeptide repeat protein n=1 Tax=Sphingomonas sp. So64.6b TaxID=2997354 RepID=UPI001602D38E|nr:tetratricopeptide repeat protein [Sphingomonas sp. So64.6b]QNA83465.1 tetratricopeptide repeat protein [Sphingomonas sp. So64.6b]